MTQDNPLQFPRHPHRQAPTERMRPYTTMPRLANTPFLSVIVASLVFFLGSGSLAASSNLPLPIASASPKNNVAGDMQQIAALPTPLSTLPTLPKGKPLIYSRSYILLDGQTNYPLLEKGADTPVPIASTTKIMTTLVALDTFKLDSVITIPKEAAAIGGSELHLYTGEKLTVHDLLYAMLLDSANDAAYTLAYASGSKDTFVAEMNNKAYLLGLTHTHYKDPAGLDDGGYSSPRDLAILTDYALDSPVFRSIVATPTYTIWSTDKRYRYDLKNSNRLIRSDDPLYYSNTIGGKTGFTYDAGHCLIAAADYPNGTRHIAVILHTNSDSAQASAIEARKLLTWAAN